MRNVPFGDLVQSVILELSQVYGSSVQRYSEPRIRQKMQLQFERLFDRYFWDQFCSVGQFTLDGVNGFATHDMSSIIKRFEDIQYIWPINSTKPLTKLPARVNPLIFNGTVMRHFIANADPARVFQVIPYSATGQIAVRYRTLPSSFKDTNNPVNFDSLALIYSTVWDYLEDDGTNPNATAKYQGLVNDRIADLLAQQSQHDIPLNATDRRVDTTMWWVSPF